MARDHGRMPGKRCKRGCCTVGELEEKSMMKQELDAYYDEIDESHTGKNFEYENLTDPNWDGAEDWDDVGDAVRVTYIPASDRHSILAEARHSTRLEGGESSPEAKALQDQWASGELTTEQLLQETLKLHNKEEKTNDAKD